MAYTDSDTLNYLGQLFLTAQRTTPFIEALGSPLTPAGTINPSVIRVVNSFEFPLAVPYDTGAGTQAGISETTAAGTGVTADTISRGQDTNTCQIFMRAAEVTYKKLSTLGTHGISLEGAHNIDGAASGVNIGGAANNPVQNELDFQLMTRFARIRSDLDYCCINGSYVGCASAATAAQTRGLANGISTNTVAAGGAYISTTHINSAIKKMVDSGAPRINIVAVCNSFQYQRLSALYEFVPMSRTEGGSAIQRIYTPFAIIGLLYDPNMPTTAIYLTEMSVCRIVICPISGQYIVIEDKSTVGASIKKQIYLQAGFDYGAEEYHCSITGLANA